MPELKAPIVVATDGKFRIVRNAAGNYVTELYDECDALGVERWKDARLGEGVAKTITLMFRDYIIREYVKQEQESE